jgi:hypothetical protein
MVYSRCRVWTFTNIHTGTWQGPEISFLNFKLFSDRVLHKKSLVLWHKLSKIIYCRLKLSTQGIGMWPKLTRSKKSPHLHSCLCPCSCLHPCSHPRPCSHPHLRCAEPRPLPLVWRQLSPVCWGGVISNKGISTTTSSNHLESMEWCGTRKSVWTPLN